MWLLYPLADGLALLLYYVIGYRHKVVRANLLLAFPEKTKAEIIRIEKKFYRNFTDNFIETLKLLSASPSFLRRHFIIDNPEVLENFYAQGRKCQLHLGHTFNWEFANAAIPLLTKYAFIVAYMPVDRVVGLSKLARLVDVYAHRMQTQEHLNSQVATAIEEILKPRGVAVMIEAEHMCMSIRGVTKPGSMTVTTHFTGAFREANEQVRFMSMLRGAR